MRRSIQPRFQAIVPNEPVFVGNGASDPDFVYRGCIAPSARRPEFAASHPKDADCMDLSQRVILCSIALAAFEWTMFKLYQSQVPMRVNVMRDAQSRVNCLFKSASCSRSRASFESTKRSHGAARRIPDTAVVAVEESAAACGELNTRMGSSSRGYKRCELFISPMISAERRRLALD